jgi:TolA-binding protein
MKRLLVVAVALAVLAGAGAGWVRAEKAGEEKKEHHPAAAEQAPMMGPGMMGEMHRMTGEMQEMMKKEQLTPEERQKMREMMGRMHGMTGRMHEMMMECPMMRRMHDQEKEIEELKKRLKAAEEAKGKS